MKSLILALFIGYVAANICTNEKGVWSYSISNDVTDFAYTGAALNRSHFCFEGCLITADAVQNFKVLLSGNRGPPSMLMNTVQADTSIIENSRTFEERMERIKDYDDPNADTCVDPALRAQIASILDNLTVYSAKNIARTLQYQLNRPGWVINVVKTKGAVIEGFYQDFNFCAYDARVNNEYTNIRLAAVDFS